MANPEVEMITRYGYDILGNYEEIREVRGWTVETMIEHLGDSDVAEAYAEVYGSKESKAAVKKTPAKKAAPEA